MYFIYNGMRTTTRSHMPAAPSWYQLGKKTFLCIFSVNSRDFFTCTQTTEKAVCLGYSLGLP